LLEVDHISVFYGTFQALRAVSIRVKPGETVGLFGPNGHGKTTILRTVSGLLTPRQGKIEFEGRVISSASPKEIVEMGVVHVLQEAHLFPEMTVMENLQLGAYVPSAWKHKQHSLDKVFSLFPQLRDRKDQRCSTLSGGERQMVAIGRGLMSCGRFLMLDEPLLGLAPRLSGEIMETLCEIKESGISMMVTEQNMAYATKLSDRMYLIENGEVALEGGKKDILASDYVREAYLGLAE
jgi:branched-chain amino acid transport system ATP-binding protein